MRDMPRPREKYLSLEFSRHGKKVWYFRKDGKRIRLLAQYGTPEFDEEYQAARNGQRPQPSTTAKEGTLAWLVDRYRETTNWLDLSLATRRQRENIFKHVLESAGTQSFSRITTQTIIDGRERRKDTPAQARNFLDAMRGLFRWALKSKLIKSDPTVDVENPKRPKSEGFIPWTEEHVAAYEARWPIGTRQRVWLDALLYTGLRRGDAVRLGRQHVRNGVATITTEKTDIPVTLPILPVLATTLAAGPCGDLTFISGATGRPLSKESFGNEFKVACKKAGIPGSAHGVRKIAATRAAEAGATVAQLEAIFGWSGGRMAALYTRAADRRKLSLEAMHKLANDKRTSIVAPIDEVRQSDRKA